MTRSTPNDKKASQRKPKRKATVNKVSKQTIKGQNVVGGINARGHAKISINQKIFTQLSKDEEKRGEQEAELKELKNAIKQKYADIKRRVNRPLPEDGNPYLCMQSFEVTDRARFFGRDDAIQELLIQLEENPTTFLDGSGRTSLLQAGILPALLKQGHLTLIVSASHKEPLSTSIKKQLLPNIEAMDFLKSMALPEFIRRVTDNLNKQSQLFILVDEFEEFFSNSSDPVEIENGQTFKAEWKSCINGIAPDAHWLFSVPTRLKYLFNLFKDEVAINPNLVTLHPLETEDAFTVMTKQGALRGIRIDKSVSDAIIKALGDYNNTGIDPTQLQLVCYMLAGGKGPLVKHWTMDHYLSLNKAEGILQSYLDSTINELEPTQRDPAWQLLSTLIEPSQSVTSESELIQKMKSQDVSEEITREVLGFLQSSHLVEYATAYKLSSDSLLPGIQAWRDKRSAMEKAKEAIWNQVRSIGGSALRGSIGGAIGFALAYWALPYVERVPLLKDINFFFEWYFYNLTLRALLGAITGFVLTLSIDLILASWKGEKKWMRLPTAMLAGGVSFALAMVLHINLHYLGDQLFTALGVAAVEGLIWGAVAGVGAVWIMTSEQLIWLKLLATSVTCGLVLALTDSLLKGLDLSAPFYIIGISGMVMPLFLLGSVLLGRSTKANG
ncbi:MAG: hypothetical protein HZB50_08530 [Chloroflexi bacterium]|nr:hypothetical protein [Chloroflexota bacterium]